MTNRAAGGAHCPARPLRACFGASRARVGASRGVTLVELMVAIVIGLLVIAAMSALFAGSSRARAEIERAGQQVENGRLAMDMLRDDIHQAGFFGGIAADAPLPVSPCVPRTGVTLNAANLGWQAAPVEIPAAIHGHASGDVPATAGCITNQKADTDVLIVRSADANPLSPSAAATASYATDWFVQVSNCSNAAIDLPGAPFVVAAGGAGALSRFTLHERDCATSAAVRRLIVRAYYVGRCSVCSGSGDGIPSLRMVELSGSTATSASIVEGIESMRIEYSLDLAGTGRIDNVRRCQLGIDPCSAADWARVSAVQVYLLARNLTPTPDHVDAKAYAMGLAGTIAPVNDKFRRRLFSSLIVAHNLAGPRER